MRTIIRIGVFCVDKTCFLRPGHIFSHLYCSMNPNQKHPWYKKSCGQELKKGLDKKEVKSKWAAKACVVLLLIKIKF